MDYYSYKPLVALERPLVLTGVPGTELAAIARMITGFTGLTPLLVERKLSHEVGHHPDRWTAEGRHAERWERERALLEATFAQGNPVAALPSHSLLRVGALRWLRPHAITVYVREQPEAILERVAADVARDPHKHWLLAEGGEPDPARILPILAQHDAVLGSCDRVLDARARSSHGIANALLAPLGLEPVTE